MSNTTTDDHRPLTTITESSSLENNQFCIRCRDSSLSSSSSTSPSASDHDARFSCRICLEGLKEPVVTKCGHLFCWPCLYEWLEPGIKAKERQSIFGVTPFQDPSVRPNASRRVCPACKNHCSVTSLVPIYVPDQEERCRRRGQTNNDNAARRSIPPLPALRSGNGASTERHSNVASSTAAVSRSSNNNNNNNNYNVSRLLLPSQSSNNDRHREGEVSPSIASLVTHPVGRSASAAPVARRIRRSRRDPLANSSSRSSQPSRATVPRHGGRSRRTANEITAAVTNSAPRDATIPTSIAGVGNNPSTRNVFVAPLAISGGAAAANHRSASTPSDRFGNLSSNNETNLNNVAAPGATAAEPSWTPVSRRRRRRLSGSSTNEPIIAAVRNVASGTSAALASNGSGSLTFVAPERRTFRRCPVSGSVESTNRMASSSHGLFGNPTNSQVAASSGMSRNGPTSSNLNSTALPVATAASTPPIVSTRFTLGSADNAFRPLDTAAERGNAGNMPLASSQLRFSDDIIFAIGSCSSRKQKPRSQRKFSRATRPASSAPVVHTVGIPPVTTTTINLPITPAAVGSNNLTMASMTTPSPASPIFIFGATPPTVAVHDSSETSLSSTPSQVFVPVDNESHTVSPLSCLEEQFATRLSLEESTDQLTTTVIPFAREWGLDAVVPGTPARDTTRSEANGGLDCGQPHAVTPAENEATNTPDGAPCPNTATAISTLNPSMFVFGANR